jgi:thioester reductase-like protein
MIDQLDTDAAQRRGPDATALDGSSHILLTGITGSVGSEIVRWLHARAPNCRLTGLLRASSDDELKRRWSAVLRDSGLESFEHAALRSRWKPVRGDITEAHLGLNAEDVASLRRDVTHIIHAAADVRFMAPLEESRRANTTGTRQVLEFAARCPRLAQCAHLSSVFIAGRRTGRILEDDLEHDAGFVSNYEQTKYEAELEARSFMKDIPLAVYRLALLPGRGRDGYVHQFGAFHRLLYYYDRGLLEMLPGAPWNRIDMAPTDWAADTLMQLFLDHFEGCRTYHVCSGDGAVSMQDFVALTSQHFCAHRQGREPLAPLQLVEPSIYDRFVERAAAARTVNSERMVGVMRSTAPHAVLAKVFDRRAMQSCLGSRAQAPAFEDYYSRIVRYCIQSDWGRLTRDVPCSP